jgi:hypothetical protein
VLENQYDGQYNPVILNHGTMIALLYIKFKKLKDNLRSGITRPGYTNVANGGDIGSMNRLSKIILVVVEFLAAKKQFQDRRNTMKSGTQDKVESNFHNYTIL